MLFSDNSKDLFLDRAKLLNRSMKPNSGYGDNLKINVDSDETVIIACSVTFQRKSNDKDVEERHLSCASLSHSTGPCFSLSECRPFSQSVRVQALVSRYQGYAEPVCRNGVSTQTGEACHSLPDVCNPCCSTRVLSVREINGRWKLALNRNNSPINHSNTSP